MFSPDRGNFTGVFFNAVAKLNGNEYRFCSRVLQLFTFRVCGSQDINACGNSLSI